MLNSEFLPTSPPLAAASFSEHLAPRAQVACLNFFTTFGSPTNVAGDQTLGAGANATRFWDGQQKRPQICTDFPFSLKSCTSFVSRKQSHFALSTVHPRFLFLGHRSIRTFRRHRLVLSEMHPRLLCQTSVRLLLQAARNKWLSQIALLLPFRLKGPQLPDLHAP